MVEVVPFQDFCIFDPTILHLTRNLGRARLSLYFLEPQEKFPALAISNINVKSIATVSQKDALLSSELLSPMDEIQMNLRNQPAKVGDILQIEFDMRQNPKTGAPLMGYKLRFARKDRLEEKWSKLTVGPIPDFARWVVKARKSAFVVMNLTAMNFFVLFGRLPKMLRFPKVECIVCLYEADTLTAFQCGHWVCIGCLDKVINDFRLCTNCKIPIEENTVIRQRDGLCPIDGCEYKERAYFFAPCGCMFYHEKKPDELFLQPCPYSECGQLIRKIHPIYVNPGS